MIQRERTTSDDRRDDRDDDQHDSRDGSCRQPGCYLPPEHEEPCIITVIR